MSTATTFSYSFLFPYSPTKPTGGSKLEMFSNVKSQIGGIGGWLGSNIPKLRKGENEAMVEGQQDVPTEGTATVTTDNPPKEEDDNSR